MIFYELPENLTVATENGLIFTQMKKLTMKICSYLSHINMRYSLKLPIPIMHHQFFRELAQNPEYIQTFCNDRRNPLHFACHQWFLLKNPQCC